MASGAIVPPVCAAVPDEVSVALAAPVPLVEAVPSAGCKVIVGAVDAPELFAVAAAAAASVWLPDDAVDEPADEPEDPCPESMI